MALDTVSIGSLLFPVMTNALRSVQIIPASAELIGDGAADGEPTADDGSAFADDSGLLTADVVVEPRAETRPVMIRAPTIAYTFPGINIYPPLIDLGSYLEP